MKFLPGFTHFLTVSALLVGPAVAVADGGVATALHGTVVIQHQNQPLPAGVGSPLFSGDSILTGENGSANLRFDDNSVFAVGKGSEFRVDNFRLSNQKEPGVAQYSLLRGGFRTVTGTVGKGNGDLYQVRTALGTISVRGSAFVALLCKGGCGNFKDGLYVKAEKGIITVENDASKVQLRAGQTAFIESSTTAGVVVQVGPAALAAEFNLDAQPLPPEVKPRRIEPELPPSPS